MNKTAKMDKTVRSRLVATVQSIVAHHIFLTTEEGLIHPHEKWRAIYLPSPNQSIGLMAYIFFPLFMDR